VINYYSPFSFGQLSLTLIMESKNIKEQLLRFNKSRSIQPVTSLCYAPFLSLNFDQSGNITACCFNRSHILGLYPAQSISEAWNGTPNKELRRAMKDFNDQLGCSKCTRMIEESNFESVLIKHFDEYAELTLNEKKNQWWRYKSQNKLANRIEKNLLPVVFEFEISNNCNLECIMCGGNWSSAIRKNREGLPVIKSPFDEAFVQQVSKYLPTLKRANFLGGEPFLISLYYSIWESIIEINPSIDVAITSNGTVLNTRAKKIINNLPNCRITLSIDSLNKTTWENIRRNGNFETLLENLQWLRNSGKLKSFSVCPMIQNWEEIPEIAQYCQDNALDIYFNIVYGPLGERKKGIHLIDESSLSTNTLLIPETSMSKMDRAELLKVIRFYKTYHFRDRIQDQLDNLIRQLENWYHQTDEIC